MRLNPKQYVQLLSSMGWRYILFRAWYTLQQLTGLLEMRFPKHRHSVIVPTLQFWKELSTPFFFQSKTCLLKRSFAPLSKLSLNRLAHTVQDIENGRFRLFYQDVHVMKGWHENPINGFIYDKNTHWSRISTFSPVQGDIKYVWDKARFGFLYDIIRYDFHTGIDKSKLVIDQIQDWIRQNPVNCGPHWICSQEIGIRILNWTFALHYYKNSLALDEPTFQNILNSIFRQAQHISGNRSFARYAVRNNHILTESLALYVVGTCYPFFEESRRWKSKGKDVFQTEICTQVNVTGTYLQHSMNYHRMVIQLLSWAIRLARVNGESWSKALYDRAQKSVLFLKACQDPVTGWLPNYGHNDGSLLFALTSSHFRDFSPQIETLSILLDMKRGIKNFNEEYNWISCNQDLNENRSESRPLEPKWMVAKFEKYVVAKNDCSLTFLHCGPDVHRPYQADQLHLDIWIDGINVLRDAGTYQYNLQGELQHYFVGTKAHNTVLIDQYDQMQKGDRFIWYNWIKNAHCQFHEADEQITLEGRFEGFRQIHDGIYHQRKVTIYKECRKWIVEDKISGVDPVVKVYQYWHPHPLFNQNYVLESYNADGEKMLRHTQTGWYSETYSHKQKALRVCFRVPNGYIKTIILPKMQ